MTNAPTSGRQYTLRRGSYTAVVAGVGATLRSLTYGGRDLIVPFAAEELRPLYRGALLAPWPNRVVDGTYRFCGTSYQLPLTEPERLHALHGLAGWLEWEVANQEDDRLTLVTTIEPQAGYPWRLRVTTTFSIGPDGLAQSVTAENQSDSIAPWGTGTHPYLVAGQGQLNDWNLSIPAELVLEVTADRLVPTTLRAVDSHDSNRFDFRIARQIGDVQLDHAFTLLSRDGSGLTRVRLVDADGSGVEISWGESCPWVQIHTADREDAVKSRLGLAVEPMTCAPDAYNSDSYPFNTGLIAIEPGTERIASWRITAIAAGVSVRDVAKLT